jgi:putative ABC transport system permease protein
MTTMLDAKTVRTGTRDGGVPARRAVVRWAWRLARREWRQQLLILAMLTVAVAATILGAGIATNTPPSNPNAATFGTAAAMVTLPGGDPRLAADIAAIQKRYGPGDVIENQPLETGTVQNVELRAQDPRGRYGAPTIALVSGRYPANQGQVAMTSQVASLYGLHLGSTWHQSGATPQTPQDRQLVGIVQNPANLLDEFALVVPGALTTPAQVTILLGPKAVPNDQGPGPGAHFQPENQPPQTLPGLPKAASLSYPSQGSAGIPPATVVLVVAVIGLVFIGLVATAGFTVMAQRRLRSLGMLSAVGAAERNVRLVMTANGAIIGLAAVIAGAVIGFAAWFGYAPRLQTVTGHVIDPSNLPWWAIAIGMALAVGTSVLAARRPARAMAGMPVVQALSGRPAAQKAVRRSAIPGAVFLAAGLVFLAFSGGWAGNSGADSLFLLGGLVGAIVGILLLAPLCVAVLSPAAGHRVPVAVRIALRDLVRYRTRSGAALGAVSFAVFLAMLTCIVASVRFAKVLDWTGPNLSTSQLIVYTHQRGPMAGDRALTQSQVNALHAQVDSLAAGLHARSVLALETAGATLEQEGTDSNNFSGELYVATPQLLAAYGITASQIAPGTDILTMRPGMAGLPRMVLLYGDLGPKASPSVLDNPKMQTVGSLPSGTSVPNTVITENAVHKLHLNTNLSGWLIQASHPLTAAQISAARKIAVADGVSIETKSGELSLNQISDGATLICLLIALGVLVMTVGLIRSEAARDLRPLAAIGARGTTRRAITGATAGALGLLGAVLGAAVATAAGLAWARSSLGATFGDIPALDLIAILIGLPLVAAAGGWLLAGRQPPAISRQPLE